MVSSTKMVYAFAVAAVLAMFPSHPIRFPLLLSHFPYAFFEASDFSFYLWIL
jgi:hypothetical protein